MSHQVNRADLYYLSKFNNKFLKITRVKENYNVLTKLNLLTYYYLF